MEASVTLEDLVSNVGTDYDTLKLQLNEHAAFVDDLNDQKGDLKFINMSGDKFQEQSRVSGILNANKIFPHCSHFGFLAGLGLKGATGTCNLIYGYCHVQLLCTASKCGVSSKMDSIIIQGCIN